MSWSPPTPYAELNAVLHVLVDGVRGALGDQLVGAYLQGSFALGDFDHHSDVDFVVAVRDELTDDQVAALQIVHARTYGIECEWARHLEGSYFPTVLLRDYRGAGSPLWYLDHGRQVLERSDHCNTALVRWVVRERGVTLTGPPASALVDPVPVAELRREIAAVMHRWGQQILDHPAPYRNRFYLGYIVLNYCRMLHDLVEGRPGSKRAGAAWAQANLDAKWSELIDRAWSSRPNPAVSVREPPDAADFESTLAFLAYILGESARYTRGDPLGSRAQ